MIALMNLVFLPLMAVAGGLEIADVLRYFAIVVLDGDWLNDWLTHMPVIYRSTMIELGKAVASALGS